MQKPDYVAESYFRGALERKPNYRALLQMSVLFFEKGDACVRVLFCSATWRTTRYQQVFSTTASRSRQNWVTIRRGGSIRSNCSRTSRTLPSTPRPRVGEPGIELTNERRERQVDENGAESEDQSLQAGERLAEARRERQISVLEIAKELHLDEAKVRALEKNEFDTLGAPVFAKGHLRKYAQLVGVDEGDMLADYYGLTRSQAIPPVVADRRKPGVSRRPDRGSSPS